MKETELKPIDILANDINQHCPDLTDNYCGDTHCVACLANALYNAGYRKQSEVIEEYRKKVYSKMEKYTVFGREYIQRIMREAEKEMKGGAE